MLKITCSHRVLFVAVWPDEHLSIRIPRRFKTNEKKQRPDGDLSLFRGVAQLGARKAMVFRCREKDAKVPIDIQTPGEEV